MTPGRGRSTAVEAGLDALRALSLLVQLGVVASYNGLHAQCPDGSTPPCRTQPTFVIDSNAVAIFPFRVTGQSNDVAWLREGGMDLLGIALDGLAGWRVISPRTLLPRAGGFTDRSDPVQAAQIARSVGAGTLVLGRAVVTGAELRVSAELFDATRSRRLVAVAARGSVANPGSAMDSLATGLAKQRISSHEGGRRPLEDYGTASPLALKAYLVAEQLMRHAQWQLAADSLREAIERDSSFALAWYQLLRTYWWGGASTGFAPGDNNAMLAGVMRDSTRLPRRLRLEVLAMRAADRGQRLEALRSADELAAAYPNDADAVLVAADNYFHWGLPVGESPARNLAAFERAIVLDPGAPEAHLHVVQLYCQLGDTAHAWRALERQRAAAPDWEATKVQEVAMRALLRGEEPGALIRDLPTSELATGLENLQRRLLFCGDSDPARAIGVSDSFAALAGIPDQPRSVRVRAQLRRHAYRLAQGRYRAAWATLQDAAALEPEAVEVLARTLLHALVTGTRAPEAEEAARRLATHKRALVLLVWHRAATSRLDSPDTSALYIDGLWREDVRPYREALLAGLRGLASLDAGDSARARQFLVAAYEVRHPDYNEVAAPDQRFSLALARLERGAGELDAAARRLHDARLPTGLLDRAEAEELRGQIAEQQSDTASAIRAYRSFIALWKDADPELQPRVQAARAALAKLEAR